ncbi:MAG: helix-turn-helix domain-containing protein [Salinigranum sp.]
MSFVVDFELTTPILADARHATPDLVLEMEDVQLPPGKQPKLVFWASGDDFSTFEEALRSDATAEDFEVLADIPDRRLYRVTLSEEGAQTLIYPVAVEHDVTLIDIRWTEEGSRISARVPTREVLFSFRDACLERNGSFRLRRIYRDDATTDAPYGVTARQREALLVALEEGYFEVPRRTSLNDLSTRFDVSDQAMSTLLRRGQVNLLCHTLARDADT